MPESVEVQLSHQPPDMQHRCPHLEDVDMLFETPNTHEVGGEVPTPDRQLVRVPASLPTGDPRTPVRVLAVIIAAGAFGRFEPRSRIT